MKQLKTTNPELIGLIRLLRKKAKENEAKIWHDIAEDLSHSRKRRVTVNLSKLNRHTQKDEDVVVPGKVLGTGKIDHPINIAAFAFSEQAQRKILDAKGKCMSVPELIGKNPKGSQVKIMG
jgi:large subunit ribosomal protein L18e